MNKLEKVALRCARVRGKPLVVIINNVHFFQNDEAGRNMLLQLQQKAEAWAASGILTMVFSSYVPPPISHSCTRSNFVLKRRLLAIPCYA